jgi:hypothetical protein
VLDALDFESGESDSDPDDSDNSPSIASSAPTRQFSQLRQGGRSKDGHGHNTPDKPHASDDHTFRIVTAKRTFVLCAPSEEDEIKWLAAFRALLNRERWAVSGPASPNPAIESSSMGNTWQQSTSQPFRGQLPQITAQPPTPASQTTSDEPPTPSATTSQGPPSWDQREEVQAGAPGLRGRSATFNAKRAVADVVKRYHPDSQAPALGQPLGGSS